MYNIATELSFQLNQASLRNVVNQATIAINNGVNATVNVRVNPQSVAQVNALARQIATVTTASTAASSALFGVSRSAATIAGAVAGVASLGAGLRQVTQQAIAFNREMIRLVQVSEEPAAEVRGLGAAVTRLSTTLGVSSAELVKTSVRIKQAGYSLSETKVIMDAVAKATLAPNFDNQAQISNMATALRQFNVQANDMKAALGSANAVAGAFAVEAGDLATAVSKAGGAAKTAGLSYNQLFALMTAVRSTTRESADQIATGLRTILARVQRSDTIDALHQLGIELRTTRAEAERLGDTNLEGQFVGGYEGIRRISTGLANVRTTDPRYSAVVEQLGGVRQISRVIPLLQQQATATRALIVAEAGKASLDVSAAQAQDAYAVKLQKAREEMLSLGRAAVESRGFSTLIDGLERGASAAAALVKALGPLTPILAGLAVSRLGAAGLGAAGLTGAGIAGKFTRGRVLAGGGLVAAALAPSLLDAAGFKGQTASAIGGGLAGAAAGGLAGSVFGPIGTAVGATAGALLGLRDAVLSTRDALAQAKLDSGAKEIANLLLQVKAGGGPSAVSALNRSVGAQRARIEATAADQSTHFFGGFRSGEYAKNLQDLTAKNLGPNLTQYAEALSAEAERAGKRNSTADPAALGRTFTGANHELLGALAALQGQTKAEASKPYLDLIRDAQRQATQTADRDRLDDDAARVGAAFSRLVASVRDASDSLAGLHQRGAALAALTEGSGAVKPVGVKADLAALVAPLGRAAHPLLERSKAADQLKAVLPAVLAEVAAGDPLDSSATFGAQVRAGAVKALGGNLSPELARGLDTAVGALGGEDAGKIGKHIAADPSKFAAHLLESFSGPLDDAAKALREQYLKAGERLTDALNLAAARAQHAGESLDHAAGIRLAGQRALAPLLAEQSGRAASSFLSLRDLQAPFNARQARLTAGGAGDVNAIARRLAANRTATIAATDARDKSISSPAALDAAKRLSGLAAESANLQSALRNLADVSGRAAAVQEKLSALQANKDSRLGYAERFIRANPDEKIRMRRGQSLTGVLQRDPTAFNRMSRSDQRQALDALDALGQTKLANGQTAAGLKRQALTAAVGPGKLQSPADAREEAGLQKQLAEVFRTGEAAQRALAEFQRDNNTRFLDGLRAAHEAFLAKLAANLLRDQMTAARAGVATAGERVRVTREQAEQRGRVQSLGVDFTTQEDVDRLKTYSPLLADYAGQRAKLNAFRRQRAGAVGADFAGRLGVDDSLFLKGLSGGDQRLNRLLQSPDFRLDAATAERVAGSADALLREKLKAGGLDEFSAAPEMRAKVADALNKSIREALAGATAQQITEQKRPLDELGGRIRAGLPGVHLERITPQAAANLDAALATFGKAGQSLGELDARLRSASDSLQSATAAVRALEQAARPATTPTGALVGGVGAVKLASGGAVFTPRGTDTVPAMLSPGEFVVNRQSAHANAPLLRAINASRKPLYRAEGGAVGTDPADFYASVGGPFSRRLPTIPSAPPSVSAAGGLFGGLGSAPDELAQARGQALARAFRHRTSVRIARRMAQSEALRDPFGEAALLMRFGNNPAPQAGRALLAVNDAANLRGLAQQQLLSRAAGAQPGDESQYQRAFLSERERLDANNDAFRTHFDSATYFDRAARVTGNFESRALIAGRIREAAEARRHAAAERQRAGQRRFNPGPWTYGSGRTLGGGDGPVSRGHAGFGKYGPQSGFSSPRAATPDELDAMRKRGWSPKWGPMPAPITRPNAPTPDMIARGWSPQWTVSSGPAKSTPGYAEGQRIQAEYERRKRAGEITPIQSVGGRNLRRYATGGMVGGTGTGDTVPALLTPGEFVMTRRAVADIGAGRLAAANRYAQGGLVGGGATTAGAGTPLLGLADSTRQSLEQFVAQSGRLGAALGGFGTDAGKLSDALRQFSGAASPLTEALKGFPSHVTHELQARPVEVVINGGQALADLEPAVRKIVTSAIDERVTRLMKERFPDA